jgi:hypothetical protein
VVFVSKIVGLEKGLLGADQLCLSYCHPSINEAMERRVRLPIVHENMGMQVLWMQAFRFSRVEMAGSQVK